MSGEDRTERPIFRGGLQKSRWEGCGTPQIEGCPPPDSCRQVRRSSPDPLHAQHGKHSIVRSGPPFGGRVAGVAIANSGARAAEGRAGTRSRIARAGAESFSGRVRQCLHENTGTGHNAGFTSAVLSPCAASFLSFLPFASLPSPKTSNLTMWPAMKR